MFSGDVSSWTYEWAIIAAIALLLIIAIVLIIVFSKKRHTSAPPVYNPIPQSPRGQYGALPRPAAQPYIQKLPTITPSPNYDIIDPSLFRQQKPIVYQQLLPQQPIVYEQLPPQPIQQQQAYGYGFLPQEGVRNQYDAPDSPFQQ